MDQNAAEFWMREALAEAVKAEASGEVPVGAVLLVNGKIIGRGHNQSIGLKDPTAHAEVLALRQGARSMQNYRLPGSVLLVTLESCAMCAGAMLHARVEEIIYGAADPKGGALDSVFQLASSSSLNHRIRVSSGILARECGALMRSFFESRR